MGADAAVGATAARGRPRDVRLDASIAAATVELLEERGYAGLAVSAVAERAGTTTAAIYRRWPTKADLVQDVVFRPRGDDVVADTGDLKADLVTMVRWTAEKYSTAAGLAALGGLLGEPIEEGPSRRRAAATEAWKRAVARLQSALDAGELRPDADPEVLASMIIGPVLATAMARGPGRVDERWITSLVASILEGAACRRS
ncbi:MAG: TetR/AcrR family transcriptional regulator [Acidimicrobiia bacterium]|nr:TetR/AcrR family transcriptional regulator [Acidimicrobiia bacterium]